MVVRSAVEDAVRAVVVPAVSEVSGLPAPDALQRSEPVEKSAPAATGFMADPNRRGSSRPSPSLGRMRS